MSGIRKNQRPTRDSHRSSSSRQSHGSGRSRQESPRKSDQQASSSSTSYHVVGTSQQQSSQGTGQPVSINDLESNNNAGHDQWGPLPPYVGMPVLNQPTPLGTEPVARGPSSASARDSSLCEHCHAKFPEYFCAPPSWWKLKHLKNNPNCEVEIIRKFGNASVATEAGGEYPHGQAFTDSNDYGQMQPPPIPAYASMPPPEARNTYANTQSQSVNPYPPQQPQYPHQQITIQHIFDQSLYDLYDED